MIEVRWVIIVLIFVFDPLAVLLLIAANISLRSRKVAKEEEEIKVQKITKRAGTNAKAKKESEVEKKFTKIFLKK